MATQVRQPAEVVLERHRWTVDEYHRMIEEGILQEHHKVELIEGEVLRMSAMNARHAATLEYLDDELRMHLPREVAVRVQTPIALPPNNEPEPDISVVRRRADRYRRRVPSAADTLLVIEVSDSSLAFDRSVKVPAYARAGIPETWIADVTDRGDAIERYSDPDPATGRYATVARFERGQEITSTVIPELSLPVSDVLGPRDDER